MNNQKHLTHQQIIQMLISPRAALDRLRSSGKIDYDDFGAIQCCYVLACQIDKKSGIECPDFTVINKLCADMDRGYCDEDDIIASRKWVDDYGKYLRRVPLKHVREAIAETQRLVRDDMNG